MRTTLLSAFTLVAFAANSVLCRLALQPRAIDAASFATVRLVSGAVVLFLLSRFTLGPGAPSHGSWTSAFVLFLYAVPFSFAYNGLPAGTGALILFGCVQVTMMVGALRSGERPHVLQWVGMVMAFAGLVYLVLPGIAAPPLVSAALMAVAGLSWGLYSLRGRGSPNPVAQTTSAFVRAVPFAVVLSLVSLRQFHVAGAGLALAIASGAIASGLGYVTWYAALRGLTTTQASVIQLSVPIIAAVGGVIFLAETVSVRLTLSTVLVLGGAGLAALYRRAPTPKAVART